MSMLKQLPPTAFGRLCQEGRTRLTMTKFELARLVGTSPTDVTAIETGRKDPPSTYVKLVTELLGLEPEEVQFALERTPSSYEKTPPSNPKYGSQ